MTAPQDLPGDCFRTLGVDAGPTTGMLYAAWDRESRKLLACLAWECTPETAKDMLWLLIESAYPMPQAAGFEEFRQVPGKTQHLRGARPALIQAEIDALGSICRQSDIPVLTWPAATIKPWASDRRLEIAGLLEPTERFTDARDAGRDALYAAVSKCGLPDPRSAAWKGTGDAVPGG